MSEECFAACFVLCSTPACSLYTWEPEREALATIPLEWHYLMVGWALSAESGLRNGDGNEERVGRGGGWRGWRHRWFQTLM